MIQETTESKKTQEVKDRIYRAMTFKLEEKNRVLNKQAKLRPGRPHHRWR